MERGRRNQQGDDGVEPEQSHLFETPSHPPRTVPEPRGSGGVGTGKSGTRIRPATHPETLSYTRSRIDAVSPVPNGWRPEQQADAEKPAEDPLHAGHRRRLKTRFLKTGPEGLPDYELMELVLFNAIPRRDTKDLAKMLIARFGSFAEAINAPENRLREVPGVGDAVVLEFKLIQAATLRVARAAVARRPALTSWREVIDYLTIAQGFEALEKFRILFLDKRNMLIADEVQGRGTVDHTPVYVREVVKRALELSASALILVHNHPSGDPTPSRADIDMTKQIVDAAKPLGIIVHDHVIIGRHGHASLKGLRLM